MIKDRRGQFTIAGLFALLIMLICLVQFLPMIYEFCENASQVAEEHGDHITAFFIRLIPLCIVISVLTAIYYYAKPLIIRRE